jgi:glycosyltransferase involved in cell wall biosynthesis
MPFWLSVWARHSRAGKTLIFKIVHRASSMVKRLDRRLPNSRWRPGIMFVQATEAAVLPPVVNAAVLMAEKGWNVTVLTAPLAGKQLDFPVHPFIDIQTLPARPSHVMSKLKYLHYTAQAMRLVYSTRPNVVYASDQLGAGPGLVAAKAIGARLACHEHDSPAPGAPRSVLRRLRAAAARKADVVIFPNEERAQLARAEIGFSPDRLHIVWNMPRKSEVPPIADAPDEPMILYYHGSITPERVPQTLVDAIRRFDGSIRLHVAGFEVPSSDGYIDRLQRHGTIPDGKPLVQYLGLAPLHSQLLAAAAQAHVGLALMPLSSGDVNMQHMTGASNKIFDYMAAGLATLVSDLPDWRREYVATGFARACDPTSVDSLTATLSWFRDNPGLRREMGARNRAKILADWNYDTAFAPVIELFEAWVND